MRDNNTNERKNGTRRDERRRKLTTVSICAPLLTCVLGGSLGCDTLERSQYSGARSDRARLEYAVDDEDALKDWKAAANPNLDANVDPASKAPDLNTTRGAVADGEDSPSLTQRFKQVFHISDSESKSQEQEDALIQSRYLSMENERSGSISSSKTAKGKRKDSHQTYAAASKKAADQAPSESFWSKISPFKTPKTTKNGKSVDFLNMRPPLSLEQQEANEAALRAARARKSKEQTLSNQREEEFNGPSIYSAEFNNPAGYAEDNSAPIANNASQGELLSQRQEAVETSETSDYREERVQSSKSSTRGGERVSFGRVVKPFGLDKAFKRRSREENSALIAGYDQSRFLPPFSLVKEYYAPSGGSDEYESDEYYEESVSVNSVLKGSKKRRADAEENDSLSELNGPSKRRRVDPDSVLDSKRDKFGFVEPAKIYPFANAPFWSVDDGTDSSQGGVATSDPLSAGNNKLLASVCEQTTASSKNKIKQVNARMPKDSSAPGSKSEKKSTKNDLASRLGRNNYAWFDAEAQNTKSETPSDNKNALVDDLVSKNKKEKVSRDSTVGKLKIMGDESQNASVNAGESISFDSSENQSTDEIVYNPNDPEASLDELLDRTVQTRRIPFEVADGELTNAASKANNEYQSNKNFANVDALIDQNVVEQNDIANGKISEIMSEPEEVNQSTTTEIAPAETVPTETASTEAEPIDNGTTEFVTDFPFDANVADSVAESFPTNEIVDAPLEEGTVPIAMASSGATAQPVVESLASCENLYEQANEVQRSTPAPESVDVRKGNANATPLTQEEIAWVEQVKGAIEALLKERETLSKSGQDSRICEARLRLLYLVIGEYDRSIQEIVNDDDPLKKFWESECRGLETLLRNQLEAIDPSFVADRLRSGYETFSGLCAAQIRKAVWVSAPACYGLYERYDEPYRAGDVACAYCELDYIVSKETAEGHTIDVECRWRWLDENGNELTPFETQRCDNVSETKLRDVVLNLSVPIPSTFPTGSYQIEIEVVDLNAKERKTATRRLTASVIGEKTTLER